MMLGDRWGAEGDPTADESSKFSLDYVRAKMREFQDTLNSYDQAYRAASAALESQATDMDTAEYLSGWIADYLEKRDRVRMIAEGLNMAAATVNAAGARMPVLSIPQTLGILPALAPFVAPAALIAGLTAAAAVVVAIREAVIGLNQRLSRAQILDAATPDQRNRLAQALADSDNSVTVSQSGTLANLAPLIKYGALAFAAYLAYKAYKGA